MAFTSSVGNNEPIINDDNVDELVNWTIENDMPRGHVPRDWNLHPFGSLQYAAPFDVPLIPRSEWADRIEEMERNENRVSDIIRLYQIPHKDQSQTNYCFPAGTLVRMADGTNKPIQDVKVLDMVLTAEGNVRRVLKTCVHDVSEPIVRMMTWGHNHLRATSEHPILTKRGYVAIGDLKIGDKIAFPKFVPEGVTFIQTGDYLYEKNTAPQSRKKYRHYSLAKGSSYSVGIPGKSVTTITRHTIPDVIHLTPGFGRLVGFYLAEGHTSPWTVHFSFNATEADTFAAECASLIRSELGCEPRIRIRKTVCQVSIHGVNWSKLFDALVSRGSDGKRLCPDLASGPKAFLKRVLEGWMDGDRKVGTSAVTVSRQLALNMFDIANAHDLLPIFGTHQNAKIGKDGRPRKHSWMIGWGDKGKPNHGTEQDDKYLWRKVRGLELEEFSGPVFNIEVEGDNSYVAEGVGVHNCWINAPTHGFEVERVLSGLPYVSLSPASGGGPITGYRNVGGWGNDALKYIVEYGLVPSEFWPDNAIDRRYKTPENDAKRASFKCPEWWELPNRSFDALMTSLFLRKPIAIGLNWWAHEVLAVDPVVLGPNRYGARIRNSWRGYGDFGFAILEERQATPDDAVCVRTVTASAKAA